MGQTTDDYRIWFDRIARLKSSLWKTWDLDEIIRLSTFDIPANYDALLPLLGFWSTKFNMFIFPWGSLTLTLLDVAAITGLPIYCTAIHPCKLPQKVNFTQSTRHS